MKIVVYGSSILSSYWNGAATYYRGLLPELAKRGHDITFCEPRAFDRHLHRDVEAVAHVRVVSYDATESGLESALAEARGADVVAKTSGVGVFDDALLEALFRDDISGLRLFWDVDAPATLAEMQDCAGHPLRRRLKDLDLILTYGGGAPVADAYRALGARACVPVYNGLDPATHHPAEPDARYESDLSLLANRLPDREARIEAYFLAPARALPQRRFLLGGNGWEPSRLPFNVRALGHVPTCEHNAFNASARAVLNVARDSMASVGFSPATRIFEAAGAGACIISDSWEGLSLFLEPGVEILEARDGTDVADLLEWLTPERARAIGAAARERALKDHAYARRAALLDQTLRDEAARRHGSR